MKYKVIKLSAISAFGLFASLAATTPKPVFAEEIVIESNGSGASSEVTVTQEAQTTVEQTNNTEITNNVTVDANTGNNEASNNTGGDSIIQTGDATVDVAIANSGNISVVDTGCCPTDPTGTVTISGNGGGSSNTVNVTNSTSNTITVNNTATVTNNVSGKAVTGQNTANNNNGDVAIKTGSIFAKETIINDPFNLSYVKAGTSSHGYLVKIDGNGAHSENTIVLNNLFANNVFVNNEFNVYNNSVWELITGENTASKNNGDVYIKTGDIVYESTITNKGNVDIVEIKCCEEKEPEKPKPDEPKLPPSPPSPKDGDGPRPDSNPTNGNGGNGGGVGSSVGNILPVTGGSSMFLFLLLNTLFLLFGLFMRLRAGRSPSVSFAI